MQTYFIAHATDISLLALICACVALVSVVWALFACDWRKNTNLNTLAHKTSEKTKLMLHEIITPILSSIIFAIIVFILFFMFVRFDVHENMMNIAAGACGITTALAIGLIAYIVIENIKSNKENKKTHSNTENSDTN